MSLKKKSFILVSICSLLLTACNNPLFKNYDKYNCNWVCEEPYIIMPTLASKGTTNIVIDVEGVEQDKKIRALSDSGRSHLYLCYDPDLYPDIANEGTFWEVNVDIKKGKLYMTVDKDYVSDYEGQTFVLEQVPIE